MKEFNIDNNLFLVGCEASELNAEVKYAGLFGIAIILDGEGVLTSGEEMWHYGEQRIFLLSPEYNYFFNTLSKTRILTVFFDPFRIADATETSNGFNSVFRHVQQIFSTRSAPHYGEFQNEMDRVAVTQLARLMDQEMSRQDAVSREILADSISLMVSLLVRNVNPSRQTDEGMRYSPEVTRVLAHIKRRLSENDHLTIQEFAQELNISQYNLNKMIIKGTGETLKAIIANYRANTSRSGQLHWQE